jgi:hypothetical protein
VSEQCRETVYVADTYRYTGRRGGFEMHYTRKQCSRRAQPGRDYCWQHPYSSPGYLEQRRQREASQ